MYRSLKIIITLTISSLFVGCVPAGGPKPPTKREPRLGTPIQRADYSYPPRSYRQTIKNYFSSKLKRAEMASYTFSKPQRAYKRRGLAYGGDIEWRGWLVDVSIAIPSRTGRMQQPKSHMVLFKNDVIVEDILGNEHQLITRLGE
jgi:hypothetical protein